MWVQISLLELETVFEFAGSKYVLKYELATERECYPILGGIAQPKLAIRFSIETIVFAK